MWDPIGQSRLLGKVMGILLHAESPDAMSRGLSAQLSSSLPADTVFHLTVNEARRTSHIRSSDIGEISLPPPALGKQVPQRPDFLHRALESQGVRAFYSSPLVAKGGFVGAVSFASSAREEFRAEEIDFFRSIAEFVTCALDRFEQVERLKEADRQKDEFLATLAHELRNPLAPIRNALEILRIAGADTAASAAARELLDRQIGQVVRLVDDLLDMSRITRGQLELRMEDVQLATVVRSAIEVSRPHIQERRHELIVDPPRLALRVRADVARLSQVFSNLLNNAAKYTPSGGKIRVRFEAKDGEATVVVQDNGAGIPAAALPHVFEMFTQADRSHERSQGLGIGLRIVERLVAMHGGTVEARSDGAGTGSEFLVRLPLLPVAGEEPEPKALLLRAQAGPRIRRVLVADDDSDSMTSLAMMLRLMGSEVRTARDGLEAVRIADEFRPDVILLDIGMPVLDGYDACRRIRSETWGAGIVIVALTGWSQEEDRRKSEAAGFDRHLVKPVDPDVLGRFLDGIST
jgi:signal transduction histidine kinase